MSQDVKLETRAVRRTWGQPPNAVDALRGIDLTVRAGELVALTGPSGSGKSTLLRILGTMDNGFEGSVTVAGQDIAALDDAGRAKLRGKELGFVFQSFQLLPHLTAAENIALARSFSGSPAAQDNSVSNLLERVGLGGRDDAFPTQLSGGQQQRVAIARALHGSPSVLLCDEPTGNLDSRTGDEIIALLKHVCGDDNVAALVVTHDPAVVDACDREVRLLDGRRVDTVDTGYDDQPGVPA